MERWRTVEVGEPGFDSYEVSDCGRVRRVGKPKGRRAPYRILAQQQNDYGYFRVELWNGEGRRRRFYVQRLVLMTWVGQPLSGHEALHLDGNPANNRLENLRWGTPEENLEHRMFGGREGQVGLNGEASSVKRCKYCGLTREPSTDDDEREAIRLEAEGVLEPSEEGDPDVPF